MVALGRTWHKFAGGGVVGVVTREVDPLRVAKFVAHEVEVALAAQRQRDLLTTDECQLLACR